MVTITRVSGMRLRVETPSGVFFIDRGDDGSEELRPTDLFLGSLGGCMLGTLLTLASMKGTEVGPLGIDLEPVIAHRPERIESISVTLHVSPDLGDQAAGELFRAAKHCKIHNTINRTPAISVSLAHDAAASEPALSDTGK